MYIINTLVPFEVLVDIDMGLLKLIEFEYHDESFFYPGILNTSEENQKYFLVNRTSPNVVESLLTVDDKDLANNLYSQFMEREYEKILKLSCNTAICDLTLLLRKDINQIVRVTCICADEKQQKIITDRKISVFKTVVSKLEDMSIKDFGTIFVKNVEDLYKFRHIEGKTIYIPSYRFNVDIDPNNPDPLLPENILFDFSKDNEFRVYTPYIFDPRKIPVA